MGHQAAKCQEHIIVLQDYFSSHVGPHGHVDKVGPRIIITESFYQVRAKSTPSTTRQWLQNLKASKVVHLFYLTSYAFSRTLVDIIIVIMVTKGPVITTTSLLVQSIITLVFPDDPTLCLFGWCKTFLHHFWFHIHEDSVCSENAAFFTFFFNSFLSSPEVSLN